jgi:four helix bundle protein
VVLQILRTFGDAHEESPAKSRGIKAAMSFRVTPQQLRDRTKKFALQVIRLCRTLPGHWQVREIAKQLLRSGTAVAANYRACQRARSDKEFCAKMGVVVEEADESQLWIELLPEAHPGIDAREQKALFGEATELTAIFTASYRTARANIEKRKAERKKERAKK